MEIRCENLGDKKILVDAIQSLIQVYRFDDFRIYLGSGQSGVHFDVPSTEWLENFTELLKSDPPVEFDRTLRASGWWFHALRTEAGVALFIDIEKGHPLKVELSLEEANRLHGVVLDAILRPFVEQGGEVSNLCDMEKVLF